MHIQDSIEAEIVMATNPFIIKSIWAELPFRSIGKNWITDDYGVNVNKSNNKYDLWLYMEIQNYGVLQFTFEAMQDKHEMNKVLKYLLNK